MPRKATITPEARKAALEILNRSPAGDETQWLYFDDAVAALARELTQPYAVAQALMCGLCATGEIRCASKGYVFIDPDIEPMGGAARPCHISKTDFGDWLHENNLISSTRDDEIRRRLRAGERPGQNTPWKEFCGGVRERCRGWKKKGVPTRGFGDKQIQRIVDAIRQEDI
jgi:hypothetical protein